MASSNYGLYRQKDSKTGAEFHTWLMRRDIPADVRGRFGGRRVFKSTTGETERAAAKRVAQAWWAQRGQEIAEARSLGVGETLTLEEATSAVERWRRREVLEAATFTYRRPTPPHLMATVRGVVGPTVTISDKLFTGDGDGAVNLSSLRWAERFFNEHPEASRDPVVTFMVGRALEGWKEAAESPKGWSAVKGFDNAMEAAVAAGGGEGVLTRAVRELLRQGFAKAAFEVEQHREYQRQRAATISATADHQAAGAASVVGAAGPLAIIPHAGDRTITEVMTSYLQAQWLKRGKADVKDGEENKKYSHLARALEELLGPEKVFRSITREDVRKVLGLLQRLPSNARKLFPGKGLLYAIERAAIDDLDLVASKTVYTYMREFSTICAYALNEGWHTSNPVTGQIPGKGDQLVRRGFKTEEMKLVFESLGDARQQDSAEWWVPAMLAFHGARANEICQLRTSDIRCEHDIHYLNFTVFDDAGKRRKDASLKTEWSTRRTPLHPELIKAGFLEFVARRRAEGAERLFPELELGAHGGYSHEISKSFARHLDSLGLTDPTLTMHGFRHGFRNAGRAAKIDTDVIDALGGWAPSGEGNRYGERDNLQVNAEWMAKIEFGDFTLGPPPVAMAKAA